MRTLVAPLAPEVQSQLEGLDDQLRAVAEGYLARLRLEPYLGRLVPRGLLGSYDVRAVLFGRDDRPDQMVGDHRGRLRVAGEDASLGPRWRIVYRVREAPNAGVRVVQVLAVGVGHVDPKEHAAGQRTAYRDAERVLEAQIKSDQKRRKR
jgi:hypothetical protein